MAIERFNQSVILVDVEEPGIKVRKHRRGDEYLKFYVYYERKKERIRLLTITIVNPGKKDRET